MAWRFKKRIWPICRFCFRQFRIAMLLLVLFVVAVFVYLNQVGLPDVVKKPILATLREHGLDVQFSRLRYRWYRGLVADDVRFERAGEPFSPQLTLREMQVRLNHRALSRFRVQVDSVVLRDGQLTWPIPVTNGTPRHLSLDHLRTDLRFLPDDQWALDHFTAAFAGAQFQLSGIITNASKMREWRFFAGTEPTPAGLWQTRLRKLADRLEQIHFSAAPELRLDLRGDARELQSLNVHFSLIAPGAETPWGRVRGGKFIARVHPMTNGAISQTELTLRAAEAQTKWASITNLKFTLTLEAPQTATNLLNADLVLSADHIVCEWAKSRDVRLTAQLAHSLTNVVPLHGQAEFQSGKTETKWANARAVHLTSRLSPPVTGKFFSADGSLGWWTNLLPYCLEWDSRATGVAAQGVEWGELFCTGSWRAPDLRISNLQGRLDQGGLKAQASLDISNRRLGLSLNSDIDPHRFSSLLGEDARKVVADCSWASAPLVEAQANVTLPAWTNSHPEWAAELLPTLELWGKVGIEKGCAYREISLSSLQSNFAYSNMALHLPDLRLARPEGQFGAELYVDQRARNFYAKILSTFDPFIFKPLMLPDALGTFDLFSFSQPPILESEIWGQTQRPLNLGFRGRVALTNFTFRSQTASGFQTELEYTNRLLRLVQAKLQRGEERLNAGELLVNFDNQLIYLTNGFSTADPEAVTKAIGPHIWRAVEAYRFSQPPTVRAHGIIPIKNDDDADVTFEIEGGPFNWLNFRVPRIAGVVHWQGDRLSVKDVRTDFYGGVASGSANFSFTTNRGTEFSFDFTTTNTLLKPLVMDLTAKTNRLEGRLSGNLFIIQANSEDAHSVFGYGDLKLRDGLIWEIPLFGIFSPVLDGIVPGLGSSRANSCACSFVITNGVIRSDDLEIKSRAMRLAYRGTVDFKQQLNARVDAELMRDVWLVGPLVSTAFWPVTKMFEYRVTGSLDEPKTKPVYIVPKILVLPFLPFRVLRGLLPQEPNTSAHTNAPAADPGSGGPPRLP